MLRVNQLIIIGGPSRSGKSFLIEKMKQGDCPYLCDQLGVINPSSWDYLVANSLNKELRPMIEKLVVHYDFYAQYSKQRGFNYLSELITNSNSVVVLTLFVPPEILIQRTKSKLLEALKSSFCLSGKRLLKVKKRGRQLQKVRGSWKKQRAYQKGLSVSLYERWFDFFSRNSVAAHWILDFNKSNNWIAQPYIIDNDKIFNSTQDRDGV